MQNMSIKPEQSSSKFPGYSKESQQDEAFQNQIKHAKCGPEQNTPRFMSGPEKDLSVARLPSSLMAAATRLGLELSSILMHGGATLAWSKASRTACMAGRDESPGSSIAGSALTNNAATGCQSESGY